MTFKTYLPNGEVWSGKNDPNNDLYKICTAVDQSLPETDIAQIPTDCTLGSMTFTLPYRLAEIGLGDLTNDTIRTNNEIYKWWFTQQSGNFSQAYYQSVLDYFYGSGVYGITQYTQFQVGANAIGDAVVSDTDRFSVGLTRASGSHSALIKKIMSSIAPAGVRFVWL